MSKFFTNNLIAGMQAQLSKQQKEILELRSALESTNRELMSMIDGYNQKLKEGICSSDLDEPDYADYQTVHDNYALLAKYDDEVKNK